MMDAILPTTFVETELVPLPRPAFELKQRVAHRFYGAGVIFGMVFLNGELFWRVLFQSKSGQAFSARIPTRALTPMEREKENGK